MKISFIKHKRFYLAAFSANLLYISTGCALTWTSPVVDKLKEDGITDDQISWIGSMLAFGGILGPSLNFLGIDTIGRKGTLLLNASCFLLSWIILGVSRNVYVLYVGRFFAGIAASCSFNSIPIYLTEISNSKMRQAVTSLAELFIGFGYLLEYCTGPYISYNELIFISALATVLFILIFIWMPESPYYFLNKNQRDTAEKSIEWLREYPDKDMVVKEINDIQQNIQKAKENTASVSSLITDSSVRKSLGMSFWLLFLQQMTGIHIITTFTEPLFELTETISPATGAILVGIVNLFSSVLAPPIVKKFGLKIILIGSGFLLAVSLGCFAAFMFLHENKFAEVHSIFWLPVVSLMSYNAFFCIGVGPLSWTVAAELFPPNLKGIAIFIVSTFSWAVAFSVMKTYGYVLINFQTWPLFTFFTATLIVGYLIACFILPDTKKLSLHEIPDFLRNRNRNNPQDEKDITYM